MNAHDSLNSYFQAAIREYWELPSLTDFGGATMSYKDVARKIAKLHLLYENVGIKPGDKVALCAKNSSMWCVSFIGTLTYGAVIVPILADFKPDNVQHLINHSDAKLAIIDENVGRPKPRGHALASRRAFSQGLLAHRAMTRN